MATIDTKEQKHRVQLLLQQYGDTYAADAGIILKNTPAPLFQLLVLSLMLSARIAADKAVSATRSLFDKGYTTADKMAAATWQQRVDAITWSGYKRYDERTATMLGQTAECVLERHRGDLRHLRDAATDPQDLHGQLQRFSGIGAVGASIFMREVQLLWGIYPFADERVLKVAEALALPNSASDLSELCDPDDFPRLCAALMRMRLKRQQQDFLKQVKQNS